MVLFYESNLAEMQEQRAIRLGFDCLSCTRCENQGQ